MATLINGAVVMADGYSFGVELDGNVVECDSYAVAKDVLLVEPRAKIKMRAHYVTDWMDSQ